MKKYFTLAIIFVAFISVNAQQYTWVNKSLFPDSGRSAAGCFTINGKGYVVGGIDNPYQTSSHSSQTWQYNPSQDTWLRKADYPHIVVPGAYFSINGKGYIMGGSDSTGHYSSDNNEYDPIGDTWTPKTPYPGNGLGGGFQFVINGIAYIGGGASNSNIHGVAASYSYNPATDTWATIADYPFPSISLICFTIDSFGYAGMGGDGNGHFFNNMYRYDPYTNTWTQIASCPAKGRFANFSCFALGGKGYFIGGTTPLNGGSVYSLGDCYVYDPITNTWQSGPGYQGPPRSGATPLMFTDSIFMIGGFNCDGSTYYRYVDELKPASGICTAYDTTHITTNDTTYTTINDTTHTSVTDTLFITVNVGIVANDSVNTLTVYPNPAHNQLYINTGNYALMSGYLLKIINPLGQIAFVNAFNQQLFTINISSWATGVYFLQILDASNAIVETKEIVIH